MSSSATGMRHIERYALSVHRSLSTDIRGRCSIAVRRTPRVALIATGEGGGIATCLVGHRRAERHVSHEVCSQVMMKFASCDEVCGDLLAILSRLYRLTKFVTIVDQNYQALIINAFHLQTPLRFTACHIRGRKSERLCLPKWTLKARPTDRPSWGAKIRRAATL